VVRGDGGDSLLGVRPGGVVEEPQQPVRQDAPGREGGPNVVLHGPEVFTDDERAGAVSFQRDEVEDLVSRVAHVPALLRAAARRCPPRPVGRRAAIGTTRGSGRAVRSRPRTGRPRVTPDAGTRAAIARSRSRTPRRGRRGWRSG